MASGTFIGLLRGINVSGKNKLPMRELCSLCSELCWEEIQSYIQSGNLVFRANAAPKKLETDLERAIEDRFGFSISVLVRPAKVWPDYIRQNPYPDESQSEPNHVMLALSKSPPKSDAAEKLQERAANGERIIQLGDALWLHFAGGMGKSKLTPALLDRLVGSPVTARNWRTVQKLHEMSSRSSLEQ